MADDIRAGLANQFSNWKVPVWKKKRKTGQHMNSRFNGSLYIALEDPRQKSGNDNSASTIANPMILFSRRLVNNQNAWKHSDSRTKLRLNWLTSPVQTSEIVQQQNLLLPRVRKGLLLSVFRQRQFILTGTIFSFELDDAEDNLDGLIKRRP
jgi:hypothetical protein